MKIHELRSLISEKVEAMQAITTAMETEKRSIKTNDERTAFTTLKSEIQELDVELKDAEELEKRSQEFAKNKIINKVENKENKELNKYDLVKAISEFSTRGLSGLEKELHDDEKRKYGYLGESSNGLLIPNQVVRNYTAAANGSHITQEASGIDIIRENGVLSDLGVTVYENLTNQLKMTFGSGHAAAKYAEGVQAVAQTQVETNKVLSPLRFQGWSKFSKEFLAQSSVMPQLMADMVAGIEEAFLIDLLSQIKADVSLNHAEATAGVVTFADILALKASLKTRSLNPKYVAGGELFAQLEGTSKDSGSGRFIIEDNKINSYEVKDMGTLLTSDTLIFGDFSKAFAGMYGSLELQINPFQYEDEGAVKVTYSKLGNIVYNPNAFKRIAGIV